MADISHEQRAREIVESMGWINMQTPGAEKLVRRIANALTDAVAQEREACAKVGPAYYEGKEGMSEEYMQGWLDAVVSFREAIRRRGGTP